jgi:glyoxylase-like metal-dependent hydrolase (beta-lactamase superfamily II)
VVVIDAATPGRSGAVRRQLAAMRLPVEAVDEIWLTHGDIDHMGSVAALVEMSGAKVVSHRADAPLVEARAVRQLGPEYRSAAYERALNWAVLSLFRYRPSAVDHPVEDGDARGAWQVVHVPGHTPGSVCYYHPGRKIAIVGDAINHRRGRLGPPPRLFTPDPVRARESVRRLAELEIDVCCFGHGPPLVGGASEKIRALAASL